MQKSCKKKIQKIFRIKKVIKRKGHKSYVKWIRYNGSLISG